MEKIYLIGFIGYGIYTPLFWILAPERVWQTITPLYSIPFGFAIIHMVVPYVGTMAIYYLACRMRGREDYKEIVKVSWKQPPSSIWVKCIFIILLILLIVAFTIEIFVKK